MALAVVTFAVACAHVPSERDREVAQIQHDLGAHALQAGRYREALAELLKGEKLDPDNADIQYALGVCYFGGFGRTAEAAAHLRRAVALRESFSDAHNALGNVLLATGDCAAATPHFETAMGNLLWGTPYLAEQNLGWCLYQKGKADEGIAHLRSAINMRPELCGAYDYLVQIYAARGENDLAIDWITRYLAKCDSDALRKFVAPTQLSEMHKRLGQLWLRQDNPARARESFTACAARFPHTDAGQECQKSLSLLP